MRKINICLSIIVLLFCISFVSAKTEIYDDIAFINHDKANIQQQPYRIGQGTAALLTIDQKMSYKTYDICLDFPVTTNYIKVNRFELKGILFNQDLEYIQEEYRICFDDVKLKKKSSFNIDLSYLNQGEIKYNVTLIPSKHNKIYSNAKFDDELIILDPYVIGSLGYDANLTYWWSFDDTLDSSVNVINSSYVYCGKDCLQFYDFKITQSNRSLANISLNGTMHNMTFTQNGAWFNSSNYINYPYNGAFNVSNFTIYIKTIPYYNGGGQGIYNNRDAGASGQGSMNFQSVFNNFLAALNNNTDCTPIYTAYTIGNEYSYVVRYQGNNLSVFLNGVYQNSVRCERFFFNNGGFDIGSISGGQFYNGTISQLAFYNRSLSDAEILLINNSGNFTDNKDEESLSSIHFNGNDYIMTQNTSLYPIKQRTISYFIKSPIIYRYNAGIFGYGGSQFYSQICFAGNGILWYQWGEASSTYTNSVLCNNDWHHVANVYNESAFYTYIDGIEIYSATSGVNTNRNTYPVIGTSPIYKNHGLIGEIDEFMIFNKSLTQEEIVRLAAGYGQYVSFLFVDESTNEVVNLAKLKYSTSSDSANFSTNTGEISVNLPADEIITIRYNSTNRTYERFYFKR